MNLSKCYHSKNLFYQLFTPIIKMSTTHFNDTVIAVCQMTSRDNKEENFKCCETLVQAAINQKASVCFTSQSSFTIKTKSLFFSTDGVSTRSLRLHMRKYHRYRKNRRIKRWSIGDKIQAVSQTVQCLVISRRYSFKS